MAYVGGANPNVVVVPTAPPGVYMNYAKKSSIVLGVLQIILAIVLIVPLIVLYAIFLKNVNSFNIAGGGNLYYFGGAFYILTGIFGIAAGVSRTKCPIVTFMVFSIFAAIFGVIGFIVWALLSAAFGTVRASNAGNEYLDKVGAVVYTMTVLYLIESIVAIWSGVICCRVMCCGAGQQQSGTVIQTNQYPQNQVAMTSPNTYPGQHYNSGNANAPVGSGMDQEAAYHEKPRSHSSHRHHASSTRY